jgi:hypothetical protein
MYTDSGMRIATSTPAMKASRWSGADVSQCKKPVSTVGGGTHSTDVYGSGHTHPGVSVELLKSSSHTLLPIQSAFCWDVEAWHQAQRVRRSCKNDKSHEPAVVSLYVRRAKT